MKLFFLILFFFPVHLIASEPPWKEMPPKPVDIKRSQDFPGVNVIHRGNTPEPEAPKRVEGSRDLRKQAAKNSCAQRVQNLLNCCKGGK